MFFFTAKLTPTRLIAGAAGLVLIVLCAIWIFSDHSGGASVDTNKSIEPEKNLSGANTSDLVSFLKTYGWEVEGQVDTKEVMIPVEFSDVFTKYNRMQQLQGFDLSDYKGKKVLRYTFQISNYPDTSEEIVANILVCDDKIIGGDICTVRIDGFMHGFALPESQKQNGDSSNVVTDSASSSVSSASDGVVSDSASSDSAASDATSSDAASDADSSDVVSESGTPTVNSGE